MQDKTQEVINAVVLIQDHASDGLGVCGCSHCQISNKVIDDNSKEAEMVAKILARVRR